MLVSLSEILKSEGGRITFEDEVCIGQAGQTEDIISFPEPVRVWGKIVNEGEVFRLTASVSGGLLVRCGRCAREFRREIAFDFEETLLPKEQADEREGDDVVVFTGSELMLDEMVTANILLAMPIRYLCSEGCRGLCAECGKDLNEGGCGCRHEKIDPRLAVLSKLNDK